MDTIDQQLIETYVCDKSEGAFRQIVERYGQLVYSAAYRRLQDHQLAEDASQATFIVLARKAQTLGKKTMLGGWLWRTATFCANNLARQRVTREQREREVEPQQHEEGQPLWERLGPRLDAALAALSAKTRNALVAHYLQGLSRGEAAEQLGIPVNTFNKRIQHGLSRLRRALARRGVAVSSAVLAGALSERAAEAARTAAVESMHTVAYGAVTGATATSHSAYTCAEGVLKMMAWTRIKLTTTYAAAALTLCGLGVALATSSGLAARGYRLREEPHYAPLEIPREIEEARAGFILDFYPDSWGKLDLNGTWKLNTVQIDEGSIWNVEDEGLVRRYYDPSVSTEGWKDVPVPYSLGRHDAAKPKKGKYWRGIAWYRRAFTIPSDWTARLAANWRVLLRFEALDRAGDAWVNGQLVGPQMTGPQSFEFDVTDKLQTNAENVLAVRVVGGGTHYRGRTLDGLWQPVRLVCVPPTRAVRTRIATPLDPASLVIKTTLLHHGTAGTRQMEARLTPQNIKGARAQSFPLGTLELVPGENEATFRIKTPGVKLWSPDEPNLYLLSIHNGKESLYRERIGFRTFTAKDGNFQLNGKKIKLMGLGAGGLKSWKAPGTWSCNHDNYMRKILYGVKQANINFLRPHHGRIPITMYNLCDELGVMVYDETNRARTSLYDLEKLRKQADEYTAWILQTHNHASCVLWDFGGNEIYTRDMEMIPVLNYFYALLQKWDLQNRPKTSSSGRLTWQRLERFPELEKSDFADSHHYTGYYHGSYREWIEQFTRHDRAAKKRYGNVPTLNCEWGFPGDTARYRGNTPQLRALYQKQPWDKADKKEWIRWAQAKQPEMGDYLRTKANWAGGRLWTTDPIRLWSTKAQFAKRFLEVYRRSGDVLDGGHFNTGAGDLLKTGWNNLDAGLKYFGLPNPILRPKGAFLKTPSYYVWKRAYDPTLICLDIYDKNTFAGHLWKGAVHLMNDADKDHGAARAVVQLRDPQGRLMHQASFWQGAVSPYLRTRQAIQLQLPSAAPTGRYSLELFLLDARGRALSDNSYPLQVVGRRDLLRRLTTKGRVGLYEVCADGAERPARTTESILKSLGVPFKPVRDFSELAELDVLLVGPKSVDVTMAKNGAAISRWVRAGGRLLCFKQGKGGQLPFLPEVSVVPGKSGTFTELLIPNHPIFAGLSQEQFDDWNGHKGLLYWNVLSPLNEGMLAVGPTTRFGQDNLKMITAGYAIGKGEILLSQYELTRRYGTDSIATRFTQNLLAYILTQPRSGLSLPFDSEAADAKDHVYLDKANAHYVDLRGVANAKQQDFERLPAGTSMLGGDVPFAILDGAQNSGNGCVMLKGRHNADAPSRTTPIRIDKTLAALYLLHYATWANGMPQGEPVFTVRIHYANGREQAVPMRNRLETGDWWNTAQPEHALIVHAEGNKSLFLTPIPLAGDGVAVQSIAFESAGKATPIILAATGQAKR